MKKSPIQKLPRAWTENHIRKLHKIRIAKQKTNKVADMSVLFASPDWGAAAIGPLLSILSSVGIAALVPLYISWLICFKRRKELNWWVWGLYTSLASGLLAFILSCCCLGKFLEDRLWLPIVLALLLAIAAGALFSWSARED